MSNLGPGMRTIEMCAVYNYIVHLWSSSGATLYHSRVPAQHHKINRLSYRFSQEGGTHDSRAQKGVYVRFETATHTHKITCVCTNKNFT